MLLQLVDRKMTPQTFHFTDFYKCFCKINDFCCFCMTYKQKSMIFTFIVDFFIRITFFSTFLIKFLLSLQPQAHVSPHPFPSPPLQQLLLPLQPQQHFDEIVAPIAATGTLGDQRAPQGVQRAPQKGPQDLFRDQFYIFKLPINRKAAVTSI